MKKLFTFFLLILFFLHGVVGISGVNAEDEEKNNVIQSQIDINYFNTPGVKINSLYSNGATFSPDSQYILYYDAVNGQRYYKKDMNQSGDGDHVFGDFLSNTDRGGDLIFSPNGEEIIYMHRYYGGKLYRKDAMTTDDGVAITSVKIRYPTYSPDGKFIVYINRDDNNRLYKKNADDNTNGTPITSISSNNPTYSPNGLYIVYVHSNGKLYKKSAFDNNDGYPITSVRSSRPEYSPDGKYIVYFNLQDYYLYIKNTNDTQNGMRILDQYDNYPKFSPDGKTFVYSKSSDGNKLYQINIPEGTFQQLFTSYDLNGRTKDSSSNGIHGTPNNISYEILNNGNQVAVFDGNSSNIKMNQNAFTNGSIISISGMFYSTINNSVQQNILKTTNNIGTTHIYLKDGRLTLGIRRNENNYLLKNTQILKLNKWYNYSANIYGDGRLELYLNGILQNNVIKEGNIHSSYIGDSFYFGSSETNTGYFNGKLAKLKIYSKTLSESEINTISQEGREYLGLKDLPTVEIPIAPSNFIAGNISSNSVSYTWTDSSIDTNQEEKFVIKDENDTVIIDNISADSTSISEAGLQANTQYQRKICAINSAGESCSTVVIFTTQVQIDEGKTTLFDFAGITISVIETAEMFKIEFEIGKFRINFSIEKIL